MSKNKTDAKVTKPKKQKKDEETVPFSKLFRYTTKKDWFLMILGTIGAAADGAAMPLLALLMGNIADTFGPGNTPQDVVDSAATIAWQFAVIGVAGLVASYVGFACWMIVGEQQSIEIRKRYFRSLLSQEIAFYDSINPNELSSKISEECLNIQQGIGEKIPNFIQAMALMIAGFVIGYIKGWQLALVMTGSIPLMTITGGLFVISMQKQTQVNNEAYSAAGAIAEEALNAIRTIVSLGGQTKETKRYYKALHAETAKTTKYSIISGVSIGLVFFTLLGVNALAFYVGSLFIEDEVEIKSGEIYTAGSVLTVFFSIQMASFTPARATPALKAFAIAKSAGAKAFKTIDRKSKISPEDPRGLKPTSVVGNINFRDVTFAYPLKPDRIILNGINFDIKKNEKTALVGESGCGKTTCLQLIERFYDIENGNGSITLDGNELKDLNLKWMRENIGYVGQEPVLFATSIKENLLMAKEDATDAEVWEALKRANAADFVETLPDKLDTFVGTNGAMLSGGQKQRLAIARAILKNPKILLLDEATSALDRRNEMEIQKTLDEISTGRTTIVIAHRLTTIQNADHIIVFDQGKVVEEGKHEDLVAKRGRYYALQHLQLQADEKEKGFDEEEEVPNKAHTEKKSSVAQSKKQSNSHAKPDEVGVSVGNAANRANDTGTDKTNIFKRLLKYSKADSHLITFGIIGALVQGAVFPCIAILLAHMIEIFALPNASDYRSRANLISLMFLVLAIVALIGNSMQMSCFNVVAERLSRRVRADVFKKYVRMPIGWFDQAENSPGALNSKLSTDAQRLNTLTGSVFGTVASSVSSFIAGIAIGFAASWQLAFVGLALAPLKVISGKMRAKLNSTFVLGNDEAYQGSIAFVSEAVNNMRTVVSFGKEAKLLQNYSDKLAEPLREAVANGHKSGLAFGLGELLEFGSNAIIFYVGALFIRDIDLSFQEMFQSIMGIIMASLGIGNALQLAPDLGAAVSAAKNIFVSLDTKPAIDIDDPNQTVRKPIKGDVEFKNVWFKYPSRDKQIFKGLNLKISASNKVALVGPSGCGKSTILALLQRFYDPDQGEVLVDGINIKSYDLKHLRESFGVVSQEPVLFNGTIEYNIKYSKEDATDEEMRQAATKASAIGFIEKNEFDTKGNESASFGTGFQRKVGPKGSQMSGGQKQRIAIARAILKNPSFLILDEATSALDSENEKIVQASLDKIMEGKTSLIVAHRISTIRDSDEIIVFNDGEIVERGNYQKLVAMQGMFYKLEKGINL